MYAAHMMSIMKAKIGVVGPGRVNNGIGEFVVKYLTRLGADVTAVAASSNKRAVKYASILNQKYGIEPIPFGSMDDMFSRVDLDAVAICTPSNLHYDHLNEALKNNVHVFCEKPFIWQENRNNVRLTKTLVNNFKKHNLILHYNTQWPYTLPFFEKMHGRIDPGKLESFSMELSPSDCGSWNMIKESAPHANSLLLAIGAKGPFRNLVVDEKYKNHTDKHSIRIEFKIFNSIDKIIKGSYEFKVMRQQPRTAAYSINGNRMERIIDIDDYDISFCSKGIKFSVEDPLKQSVSHFLRKIRGLSSEEDTFISKAPIYENMKLLAQLYARTNR